MRRWFAGIVAVFVAVLGLVVPTSSAQAAKLVASNPAAREELSQQPGWVTLAFDDRVRKEAAKVLVVDAGGKNVATGDLVYMGSSLMVQLVDNLPKGTYTVKYRVNRSDGEPEGGAFQFAYGKGHWTSVDRTWTGTAEQPPEMANPDPYATGAETTPTAVPSEPEVETQTPTPSSAAPTAEPTLSPTPEASPAPGPDAGGALWPWLAGGVVLLGGIGAAAWFVLRGRRGR